MPVPVVGAIPDGNGQTEQGGFLFALAVSPADGNLRQGRELPAAGGAFLYFLFQEAGHPSGEVGYPARWALSVWHGRERGCHGGMGGEQRRRRGCNRNIIFAMELNAKRGGRDFLASDVLSTMRTWETPCQNVQRLAGSVAVRAGDG